jgi:hypothetical protein
MNMELFVSSAALTTSLFHLRKFGHLTLIQLHTIIIATLCIIASISVNFGQGLIIFYNTVNTKYFHDVFLFATLISLVGCIIELLVSNRKKVTLNTKINIKIPGLRLVYFLILLNTFYLILINFDQIIGSLFSSHMERSLTRENNTFITATILYLNIPIILFIIHLRGYFQAGTALAALSICLALFIGYRGLMLSIILPFLIMSLNTNSQKTKKILKLIFVIALIFSLFLFITIYRAEAQSSVLIALINRRILTPIAQMEVAYNLFIDQSFPGEWILKQFSSKLGSQSVTLNRLLFLHHNPLSVSGTGSATIFGDLLGNFGRHWYLGYSIFCSILVLVQHSLKDDYILRLPLLCFAQFIIIRITFFGLSSVDIYIFIFMLFSTLSALHYRWQK